MLEAAISAAQNLFSPGPLIGMAIVLPVALASGLIPAGGLPTTSVVLSFAGYIDPWIAMSIVVFSMAAGDITEPVPAILLGVPGARSAQATVLDGYPMARRGLAGEALGASYTTTLVGGLFGGAVLLAALPVGRELLKLFGSSEFFLLSLMGILAIAIISAGAFVKGMLTAAFGIAIASIGFTNVGGVVRADMGIDFLWEGFGIVPIVIGLFAIPEAMDLVIGDSPVARERLDTMMKEANKDVLRGMKTAMNHKWLMLRSSFIGTFVGAMPGVGGATGHWIAYVQARQTEKGAVDTFGKGDIRGVIAADAANNSSDGGVLIPTLVFGIPGAPGMVLVLAILILSGITPGPPMLSTHLDLTIAMVYIIILANIIVVPIMLLLAPYLARVSAVPPNILAPLVIAITTLAAYQASRILEDLLVVLAFAVLGVFMKRYGWPRPPILIAVALAPTLERFMWITVNTYGFGLFLRVQSLVLIAMMIALVYMALRVQSVASESSHSATSDSPARGNVPEESIEDPS